MIAFTGIMVFGALTAFYFAPTFIALIRHHHNAVAIGMLNFFLGWTIIGWILALVWALAASNNPHVIVIENGRVVRP